MFLTGLVAALLPWALGEGRPWFPRAQEWFAVNVSLLDGRAAAAAKAYSGHTAAADLVILGDSTMMAAFWGDPALSAALHQVGLQVQVSNLATGGQLPAEGLFLVSRLPLRAGQTVLVSYRFSALRRAEAAEHLDRGDFLRDPAAAPTRWHRAHAAERGLPGAVATQFALARQRLHHQVLWPMQHWASTQLYGGREAGHDAHAAFPDVPADPAKIRHQWSRINLMLDRHFDAALVQASDALDELFERLRAGGCRVIFVTPPKAGDAFAARHPDHLMRYEALIERLAERHRIERLDLNPAIEWAPDDLGDLVHLSRSGRDKWSRAFVEWAREDAARRLRGS